MDEQFQTVKSRVEIFHFMHNSIDSDKNDLANTKRILHDKFIRVEEVMAELEKHKFCSEYHKIQSKDNPEEFYKESCLFVIWKKLKDSLESNKQKEVAIPPIDKSVGILANDL